jgi:hypothetical protein
MNDKVIPPHGGYGKLLSYQKAEIVYDATVKFCSRFFGRYDRLIKARNDARNLKRSSGK